MSNTPDKLPASARRAVQMGERVHLRHPVGADQAEYIRLRDESEMWLSPWEATPPGQEPPDDDLVFQRLLGSADTPQSQRFLLCVNDTGRIAGQVSLNQIVWGAFRNTIAGYWIGAAYAGKGLMTQGLTLALRQAFDVMKLHRVEANIIPGNAPSKALVRRLGFRYEGLAKRYLNIAQRWQDHEHWAMTAEEWQEFRDQRRGGGTTPT